jgi:hypothetical protein
LESEDNTSSNLVLVAKGGTYVKKCNGMILKCWKCGNHGHERDKCPDGENSEKGSESNASHVSLTMGDGDIFRKLKVCHDHISVMSWQRMSIGRELVQVHGLTL